MNIESVSFYNQKIQVLNHEGKPYVAMKSIVENIGLDWDGQRQRIRRNEVLDASTVMITAKQKSGVKRELLCLPLGMLNGWLFGIEIKRCKPEIRDVLRLYQTECFDVLYKHFMPLAGQLYPTVRSNIANAPENLQASRTFAIALMINGAKKHDEISNAYELLKRKLLKISDDVREIERMIHHIDINDGDIHDGFREAKTYLFLDGDIYKDAVPRAKAMYKPLGLDNR